MWARYANEQRLPVRRIEVYLAQIAYYIAATMGGSKSKLSDFLIDFVPPSQEPSVAKMGADALAMIAGTNVRVLGASRRKRQQEDRDG